MASIETAAQDEACALQLLRDVVASQGLSYSAGVAVIAAASAYGKAVALRVRAEREADE